MIQASHITLLLIIVIISHIPYTLWKAKKDLHMMQLNSYRNKRYFRWLGKNLFLWQGRSKTVFTLLTMALSLTLVVFRLFAMAMLLFVLFYALLFICRSRAPEKKPLIFTSRAIRLYATNTLLLLFGYAIIIKLILSATLFTTTDLFFALVSLIILTFASQLLLLLSNFLLIPIEALITQWYFNDAKKHLQNMKNLIVIGITGSFGKTTTKYVLHEILRQKYNTLMPPGSFNTPMGISKIIRSKLKPTHEIFVAEMSAKQKGDIAELCELAKPQFGIITSIGKQHLETFGSIENIKQTKNELITNLPDNGVAFFNMDDIYCQELATLTKKKSIYYGINASQLNYRAQDIQVTGDGSTFGVSKNNALPVTFTTKLLGQHNIYNILAAIAAASELGMPLTEMIYPIKQLRPIEHRLALRKTEENITIIDDAFNSNPVGSKMALDVLAQIKGAKKIIVTPGMIELGSEEYALNKQFGIYIAAVCDYVILVGKRQTQAIFDGLMEKTFNSHNIYVATDFTAANSHLRTIMQPGDVVLFENDLPVD